MTTANCGTFVQIFTEVVADRNWGSFRANTFAPSEDDRRWDEAFAQTTDEDFALLSDYVNDLVRQGGTRPLDFNGR